MLKEDGFGLIEVLIAVGVMGFISLGLMRMFEGGYTKNADLSARQELREFRDELYASVTNSNCGLTAPGVKLIDANITVNTALPTLVNIPKLYGNSGQVYEPGESFGQVSIESGNAITLGPPAKTSPYIKDLPDNTKTDGGYFPIQNYFAGEIVVRMRKPAGTSQNKTPSSVPMRFLAIFNVNGSNKLTECQSISEVAKSMEACQSMQKSDAGKNITFIWDPETFKCIVEVPEDEEESSGSCDSVEVCSVGSQYILDNVNN